MDYITKLNRQEDTSMLLPLSQCSKCGSEVPEDEIDWDMMYSVGHLLKAFGLGLMFAAGIAAIILFLFCA